MDVKLLDQNKKANKVKFLVEKTNAPYINTLRRLAISEVSIMAIEDVEFRANSSALYDEMVALRLGLIPLKTDLKSYNLPKNCTCKGAGCARCQLKLILKVKGPKTVYSGDLKSKDPKVKPVYDKMPIAKLLEGQELILEATATLGKGIEHAKWSPGLAFYQNVPILKIVKQPEDVQTVANSCPKKVFDVKAGKLVINDKNLFDCDLCEACLQVATNGEIEVKPNNKDFIFTLESWGQLEPKEIMQRAVEEFNFKLADFKKLLK